MLEGNLFHENPPFPWEYVILTVGVVVLVSIRWLFILTRKALEVWYAKIAQVDKWTKAVSSTVGDEVISHGELLDGITRVVQILEDRTKYFQQSMDHHAAETDGLETLVNTVVQLERLMKQFVVDGDSARRATQIRIEEMRDAVKQQSTDQLGLIQVLVQRLGAGQEGNRTKKNGASKRVGRKPRL